MVNLVKDAGLVDVTAISSLRATVLERVRRLSPRMGNQLIVSGWRKVRQAKGLVGGYNVPARLLSEQRVRRLHRQGAVVLGRLRARPPGVAHAARRRRDRVVTPDVTACVPGWAGATRLLLGARHGEPVPPAWRFRADLVPTSTAGNNHVIAHSAPQSVPISRPPCSSTGSEPPG